MEDEFRRNKDGINCPRCGYYWGAWGYGCRSECEYETTRKLQCDKGCEGSSKKRGWCVHDRPEIYNKNGCSWGGV